MILFLCTIEKTEAIEGKANGSSSCGYLRETQETSLRDLVPEPQQLICALYFPQGMIEKSRVYQTFEIKLGKRVGDMHHFLLCYKIFT